MTPADAARRAGRRRVRRSSSARAITNPAAITRRFREAAGDRGSDTPRSSSPVPVGTPLGGYAARTGPSTGTRDPLQVCALALDGLTWVVADLPYVHEDLTARGGGAHARPGLGLRDTHPLRAGDELPAVGANDTPGVADRRGRCRGDPRSGPRRPARARSGCELRRTRLSDVGGQRSGARPRRTVPVDTLSFVGR